MKNRPFISPFLVEERKEKKTNNHTIITKNSLTSEKLSNPYHQMTVTVTIIINNKEAA